MLLLALHLKLQATTSSAAFRHRIDTREKDSFPSETSWSITNPNQRGGAVPTMEAQEESAELSHVQEYWDAMKPASPIYSFLLPNIRLVEAKAGYIRARLPVLPIHLNSKGTLHGTVSACLTDWAGGLAIAATGRDKTGLSTDIHTTFISTAREGDMLEIEGKAGKVGSSLAFTTVEIWKLGDEARLRTIVCTGSHTKYVKQ